MKNISPLIIIITIVCCNNNKVKKSIDSLPNNILDSNIGVYKQKSDTDSRGVHYSPWNITLEAQKKEENLKRINSQNYARNILKKYTYCNCLTQSLRLDSFYKSSDNSMWYLQIEHTSYPSNVFDSLSEIIDPIVKEYNLNKNPYNTKLYNIFCLNLYESKFLDSLVNSFDKEIIKVDD